MATVRTPQRSNQSAKLLQITGASPEGAHRLGVPIWRHCRDMHPGADIDRCRIGMGRDEVSLGAATASIWS